MASAQCTFLGASEYNGSWRSWSTTLKSGYTASSAYVTVLKFKTPDLANAKILDDTKKLTITFPYCRTGSTTATRTPTEGTFYLKLSTTDPTAGSVASAIPNSATCDGSVNWSQSDMNPHWITAEISSTELKANTTYYLAIGADCDSKKPISIGYYSGSEYIINKSTIVFNYTIYTNGSAKIINIIDNGNNTYNITGTVTPGDYNNLQYLELYWTDDDSNPGSSNTRHYATTIEGQIMARNRLVLNGNTWTIEQAWDAPNRTTSTIKAKLIYVFQYNDSSHSYEKANAVLCYSNIGTPSIEITDNHNNSFKITGAAASSGWNNPVKSTTYSYGYDTNYGSTGTGSFNLTVTDTSKASRTVYAKAVSVPTWNGDTAAHEAVHSTAITYYAKPSKPGIPKLSYTKNRLTIKEDWRFDWTAATAGNSHAHNAVKGYRIRLYKNGVSVPIRSSSGTVLSAVRAGTDSDYIYDRESTSTSITIDPIVHGFNSGDTVSLGVYSYSKNGIGGLLFGGSPSAEDEQESAPVIVQNAGIVHIKAGANDWREGQVWVKVNKNGTAQWVEAETVNVKTSSGWKESQ